MSLVSTEFDITKLFDLYPEIERSKKPQKHNKPTNLAKFYQLIGLITYHGIHCTVYVYHSRKQEWIYCDDSKIRSIGSWKKVLNISLNQNIKMNYSFILLQNQTLLKHK